MGEGGAIGVGGTSEEAEDPEEYQLVACTPKHRAVGGLPPSKGGLLPKTSGEPTMRAGDLSPLPLPLCVQEAFCRALTNS
jgi:hypothetical protein